MVSPLSAMIWLFHSAFIVWFDLMVYVQSTAFCRISFILNKTNFSPIKKASLSLYFGCFL